MFINYTKDNPLKVVTLCSGYDSQCMALDRIKELNPDFDYELVAWSEIDKYAIAAHNAVYPQWKERNLGDMTKIDWEKFSSDIDLLFYSTPCFIAGTLVMTDKGLKEIQNIEVGDKVLTHTNTFKDVTEIMVHPHGGFLFQIKASCFDELICTPEHPFYVRKRYREWNNSIRRWSRKFTEPYWCEAKDLTKDTYLGYAVNTESRLPKWEGTILHYGGHDSFKVNELSKLFDKPEFWYVIGRYIGDGWIRTCNGAFSVLICCSKEETAELEIKIKKVGFKYCISEDRTVNKFTISSKELVLFLSRYGRYAHGKRIDGETLNLPVNLLSAFIDGYVASDGCYSQNVYKATSVSRELIYGLAQCVAKVYHCNPRVYRTKRNPFCIIEGRKVNQKDSFQLIWHPEKRKQDQAFYEDGYIWFPISEINIKKVDVTDVFNLEVDGDHSYTANGAIVHNCTDFSNAGKQAGGEEGSGTRSSILWYTRNAIKAKRPRICIMENVKALVSAKFKPLFQRWEQELASYGYNNYCKVLNAKDYGIPQNRERIFLVSIRDEQSFSFGEPFQLELRLKDMLEEKVDEKYYLDDEKVAKFVEHCDRKQAEGCGFKFEPSNGGGAGQDGNEPRRDKGNGQLLDGV